MKKTFIVLAVLAFQTLSQTSLAFDCNSVKVNTLALNLTPRSVFCIASGLSGKRQEGPRLAMSSLAWPLGSQVEACQEVLLSLGDPKGTIEYCAESDQESFLSRDSNE